MTEYFPDKPILIAHRGASGCIPEHTLAAYMIDIEQGEADGPGFVKSSVMARDRHEPGSAKDVTLLDKTAESFRRLFGTRPPWG